jgi:Putative auto-transporter adhesin, head GIN domain
MKTAHLLAATILLGGLAACTEEPTNTAAVWKDDSVARTNEPVMAPTDVAMTSGTVVPVGHFDSVSLSGGGHIVLRYGTAERVTLLKGSTQYTHIYVENGRDLKIEACNTDCPMQYDLEIEVVMPRVAAVAISGGGHIESAPGFPTQGMITAAIHGGGSIDIHAIDAADATAAVNGGGRIRLHSDKHLTAAVNGGGSIGYWGAPEVTSAINGGGSVHREDGSAG